MPKFLKEKELSNGWSRWVPPRMRGYKMGCCGCQLVHDTEFRVVRVTKRYKDGSYDFEVMSAKEFRVHFRARRNERSSAALRREEKKRKAKKK